MKKSNPDQIRVARMVAKELKNGESVNLGVGIPTLVPDYLDEGTSVFLQSENGLLGIGPTPSPEEVDPEFLNASKKPISAIKGASVFDSADSFAMIRGGHIDVAVLGALQVDERGMIANWAVPGKPILGVGGAMDLVTGAKRIVIAMTHTTKEGLPKIVPQLEYSLSGIRPANVIATEKAVFRLHNGVLVLEVLGEGVTLDDVRAITTAKFEVSLNLKVRSVS
jgi:3-oxoacid CoA-transferase B subunit